MFEIGQNWRSFWKRRKILSPSWPGRRSLISDLLAILLIGAGGEQDDAHTSAAELALDTVGADLPLLIGTGLGRDDRLRGIAGSEFFVVEAGGEGAEALIVAASFVEKFLQSRGARLACWSNRALISSKGGLVMIEREMLALPL